VPGRVRGRLLVTCLSAGLAGGLAVSLTACAGPGAAPAAATTAKLTDAILYSVSATSGSNAWAVGGTRHSSLILHWNGRGWSRVPSPDPGTSSNYLTSVSAVSATDAWAAGTYDSTGSSVESDLMLHWNGYRWKLVNVFAPGPNAGLSGVSAVSAADVWAIGDGILHWDGHRWTRKVLSNQAGKLIAVSALSGSEVWAAGTTTVRPRSYGLIMHWNGHRWRTVRLPGRLHRPTTIDSSLTNISSASPRQAWAVGLVGSSAGEPLTLHWNGHAWKRYAAPDPGGTSVLSSVAVLSPSAAWAVGSYLQARGGSSHDLALHWNGQRWTRIPTPAGDGLTAVTVISRTDAWAVGDTGSAGLTPDILHWDGGQWTKSAL
jgi:hypothetical protein